MSVPLREDRFLACAPDLPRDAQDFAKRYLALAGADPVPALEAFFDRPPFEHMPRVVVADILDAENFTVRYFGTGIVDIVGGDHTGITARETRTKGLDDRYAGLSWFSVNFPCGFLSRRLVYRQNAPGVLEAAFELLTIAVPARRNNGVRCLIQYHSTPHMTAAPLGEKQSSVALKVIPLRWLDTGSGVPDMPIDRPGAR
jgi:hypothetical protein